MRRSWDVRLKQLILLGFCAVSALLLSACFGTSYAFGEENPNDWGSFSEAYSESHSINGWDTKKEHYYEKGQQVRSKEIYDAKDRNWYWIDENGFVARNKDVYLQSNGGKWVRYDAAGHMVKGEDYRYCYRCDGEGHNPHSFS